MKKFLTMIAALAVVFVPNASVLAASSIEGCEVSSTCYVYQPGDEVNFYKSRAEESLGNQDSGISTIVLSDAGSGDKYVKVLASEVYSTSSPYYDSGDESVPGSIVIEEHKTAIETTQTGETETLESAKRDETTGDLILSYITLDELINVFGATSKEDGTYEIDATLWGETFKELFGTGTAKHAKGFYAEIDSEDSSKVWVVEYGYDTEDETGLYLDADITSITVKEVSSTVSSEYAYVPVMYFDKTYECLDRNVTTTEEMACYDCSGDYKWLTVGSQAETCTLVENVLEKANCVKNVKTGVQDYIIEFVGLAAVCGLALVLVKKKDLFRKI